MVETPQYTYPLLTKRPIRLARMADRLPWPSNVWVGVSIEHRAKAWRADQLREVPAAIRFISAEPLLGPLEVDLGGSTRVTTAVSTSLPTTRSPRQWPGTARPGARVGRVGQADREPAVSSSELSTSSP
jgi:protein gp37